MKLPQLLKTAEQLLKQSGIDNCNFEAKVIIETVCGRRYAQLDRANELPLETLQAVTVLCNKRAGGYPLQYIAGAWPFGGLELAIGDGVLIPRPETQEVVAFAAAKLGGGQPIVIDLCAGSGAIALSLKALAQNAQVTAVELMPQAFAYLEKNAAKYSQLPINLVCADVFGFEKTLADESADMIVSNPPYITTADMAGLAKELEFEPRTALCGGEQGVDFYSYIARSYKSKLKKGGCLVFEIGYNQQPVLEEILGANGYAGVEFMRDSSGNMRGVRAYSI